MRDSIRRAATWATVAVLLTAVAMPVRAESLWDRRQRSSAYLYTDNLAAQVGDSLTVLIAEESSFEMEGERTLEKNSSSSGSVEFDTPLAELSIPRGQLSQNSSRSLDGSVDYTDTRTFADSVTVSVVDRLPNGNMVVAGRSHRRIDGERTNTVLTGIVKPEDISGGNTVSSRRVAYLNIYYEPQGPSESYVRDGWFNSILNYIWPF